MNYKFWWFHMVFIELNEGNISLHLLLQLIGWKLLWQSYYWCCSDEFTDIPSSFLSFSLSISIILFFSSNCTLSSLQFYSLKKNQFCTTVIFQDDYYLNLVDWSSTNFLSVALGNAVYLWSASNLKVSA